MSLHHCYSLWLLLLICCFLIISIGSAASQNHMPALNSAGLEHATPHQRNTDHNLQVSQNIHVTTPSHVKITNVGNTTADLQNMNTAEIKTIDLQRLEQQMNAVQISATATNVDAFDVTITFPPMTTPVVSNTAYVHHTISWGNGDVSRGDGVPVTAVSYTYTTRGSYDIAITLTDSDNVEYSVSSTQTFALSTLQYVQLWSVNNKETIALSSVGISGLAVLGYVCTESGRYKLLSLFTLLFPMMMHTTEKEDVLDHFVRGQIYGFIKTNPGAHYQQLKRTLDIKNGTLSHHLYVLEKTGLVKSRMEKGLYRAFYTTDMRFPDHERYRLTELQLAILKIVRDKQPITQKDIARRLQQKHQTINYNIKVLHQAGLLSLRRTGRRTLCTIQRT